MSFKILPTPAFERELKKLSKRYSSLKNDLVDTIALLKENPTLGESRVFTLKLHLDTPLIPIANSSPGLPALLSSPGNL